MPASCRSTRRGALARARRRRGADPRGRAAAALLHRAPRAPRLTIPTTRACSTTWCASSASASPPWSPTARPRPRQAAGGSSVDYEVLPAVFDPEAGDAAGRAAASTTRDRKRASTIPRRNIVAELHGHIGDVEAGLRRSRLSSTRRPIVTQRVQHAASRDPWRDRLARRRRAPQSAHAARRRRS